MEDDEGQGRGLSTDRRLFDRREAERIAAAELSPQQARENVKTLRTMLKRQNAWKTMKDN